MAVARRPLYRGWLAGTDEGLVPKGPRMHALSPPLPGRQHQSTLEHKSARLRRTTHAIEEALQRKALQHITEGPASRPGMIQQPLVDRGSEVWGHSRASR